MTIKKKILLILPLCIVFIFCSQHLYSENTFLYDDSPLTLSYFDSNKKECPHEFGFIKQNNSPTLIINILGSCIPILHTERTGALSFNIVNFLGSVLSKKDALLFYKMIFSIILIILYLKFAIELSNKIKIEPTITTLLFFFSPYFFFIYEPYLVEKMIPPAVLLIHLVLFSKKEKSTFIAGLLSSLLLFLIKLTFLFELIPVFILHLFYFKKDANELKKFSIGFLIGLIPLFIFNFLIFSDKWVNLAGDITSFRGSIFENLPHLFELIFLPASFYFNGLFYLPEYTELTEFTPLIALTISLIISITYSIKKKDTFVLYLFLSFVFAFIFSYAAIMSKAKSNSIIYISSIGLYIPVLINFGLTRIKSSYPAKYLPKIIQSLLIGFFIFTMFFEAPRFEIISGSSTKDYFKTAEILERNKVRTLFVDDVEKLNIKYFIPDIKLYSPQAFNDMNSRSQSFAILSKDLIKFHPKINFDEILVNFDRINKVINKNQNISLDLFLWKH